MERSMICYSTMNLRLQHIYILNSVPIKVTNKKSNLNHLQKQGCPTKAWFYRLIKGNQRTISCYFIGCFVRSRGTSFMISQLSLFSSKEMHDSLRMWVCEKRYGLFFKKEYIDISTYWIWSSYSWHVDQENVGKSYSRNYSRKTNFIT